MTSRAPGRQWGDANELFRNDEFWVGGDGSYSFPIGADRVVWIFADSFVTPDRGKPRAPGATMINNSVGVQRGLDPTAATMSFHWRRSAEGKPASFFATPDEGYLWPCNGVLLEGRLLMFAMRVRARTPTPEEWERSGNLASFEVFDWASMLVGNPEDDPGDWQIRYLDTGASSVVTTVGAGSVFVDGDHVYAHATSGSDSATQYLGRWRVSDAADGHVAEPQWWYGADVGWASEGSVRDLLPVRTVEAPQTEFTVHREPGGPLVWTQTNGLFGADIVVRTGDRPEGPWSEFTPVFHPPEGDVEGGFVYGGKAHPEQAGAGSDLVLTYNNNSLQIDMLMNQPELYYPTFVRVPRSVIQE